MNHAFVRIVSRLLIVSLACLPFQSQAELIGTHQAVSGAQALSARASLAGALESYGLEREQARERVAALTDAEAVSLAARVNDAPAGATGGELFGILFVLGFLVWRFIISDQAQAEGKK